MENYGRKLLAEKTFLPNLLQSVITSCYWKTWRPVKILSQQEIDMVSTFDCLKDPIRQMPTQEMETIDEQSEFISLGLNKENYDIKTYESTNDMKRLCGGCMGGTKEQKTDSDESMEHQEYPKRPREPQRSPLASSTVKEEMCFQLPKRKLCKNAGSRSNVDERIEYLEGQIEKMHIDLIHIRKNMLPPESIQKFNILSDRLTEINQLLMELKFNCLRLQQTSQEDVFHTNGERDECYRQLITKDGQHFPKRHDYDCPRYSKVPRKKCIRIIKAQDDAEECEVQTRSKTRAMYQCIENEQSSSSSSSASEQDHYPQMVECVRLERDTHITGEWPNCASENLERAPRYCPTTYYEQRISPTKCQLNPKSRYEPSRNRGEKQTKRMSLTGSGRYNKYIPINLPNPSKRYLQKPSNTRSYVGRVSEPYETFKSHQHIQRYSAGNGIKLPIRRNPSPDGRSSTTADSEETISHNHLDLPLITKNLSEAILDIIQTIDHGIVALTVILESNDLYHINISVTDTGQSLADVYTTEKALKQAERKQLFERFLTFFVMNSSNTLEQKNRILRHSFEFIDMENSQKPTDVWMTKKPNARKHSQYLKHISRLNSLKDNLAEEDDEANNLTHEFQYVSRDIDNHDNSKPRLKAGKGGEKGQVFPNILSQLAATSTAANSEIQDKIERMRSLEQQVQSLQEQLYQIREKKMFPFKKENQVKFDRLSERLKEFKVLLGIVWNNYKRLSRSRRDVSGNDHLELPSNSKNGSQNHAEDSGYAPPSAECQKFSNEINNQPTILEKHLLMMKDFRTDAELRRQRLEKKRQEKLVHKQRNSLENIKIENHELKDNLGESKTEYSMDDEYFTAIGENDDTENLTQHPSNFKNNSSQSEPLQGKCIQFECDTTSKPIQPTESVKQQHAKETITASKEIHTDPHSHVSSMNKVLQNNSEASLPHQISLESPMDTDFAATLTIPMPPANVPLIRLNLRNTIQDIIRHIDHSCVALTVVLESDELYQINISTIDSGQSLGILYATEDAVQQAQDQHLFSNLLTFFIVNAENSWQHKIRQLGHSFEIIN